MPVGTVKKLVAEKGFGFIKSSEGVDVFFHHSIVADRGFDNLTEGQQVEYTVDKDGGSAKGKDRERLPSRRPRVASSLSDSPFCSASPRA